MSARLSPPSCGALGSEDDTCARLIGLRPEEASPARASEHMRRTVEGSEGIDIKTRGMLEKKALRYVHYVPRPLWSIEDTL